MKIFRKNDLILIGGLLVTFLLILLVIALTKKGGNVVQVSVDGVVQSTYLLSENGEYTIDGYNGGKNTLVIQSGKAYVIDSSCPDHLCEYMGTIDTVGQSIICLPNRVVVEVIGANDQPEYDAIVGG